MNRYCLDCHEVLIGRSDKKFCNDACRSNYNNKVNHRNGNYIRQVNAILKRNRNILLKLNPSGKTKVSKEKLAKLGFNFQYSTHTLSTSKGDRYQFCYEFGYLFINNMEVLLVQNESLITT